ncbi:ammonium transporter [Aurantiacibacter gangjinensis]|uniref:Ammonium transporter n=2 Tax=Aurantiacibacter gangjinensis TaxID=502682 RepID=A0A0G9MWL8_9SPHN|nr:ammonium transporter [Aurantiacibacter gangjinensis]KLE33638.1 ammonium transporter [Aurantiacibacter gangjinensis]
MRGTAMLRMMIAAATLLAIPAPALAQEASRAALNNSGDTAMVIMATPLVLLIALPGLALFYAGLVRARNVLSVMLQIGAVVGVVSVLWIAVGYTLAFGNTTSGFIGDGSRWMMIDLASLRAGMTLPESTFAMFQLAFAVLAPALMVGAWVGRARFGWVLVFAGVWSLLVYAPVAHWIWGGGWLGRLGVTDFAGGLVVHMTAGVSALVVALLIGKREGFSATPGTPHASALTLLGTMLIWVGWLGRNGGSALLATDDASMAIVNTHMAAAAAALTWLGIEKWKTGKASAFGFGGGALAGLVAITPAAGLVTPGAALVFGIVAGLVCSFAAQAVRTRLAIDDTLSVFAINGVGGMLGALLVGVFLHPDLGGTGYPGEMGLIAMLGTQALGVAVVAAYSAIMTAIIAIAVSLFIPMRVEESEEIEGLDASSHGGRAWDFD